MTSKGQFIEQAPPSTTHFAADGSGANPPTGPETPKEESAWQKASPWVHGALGVASFIPGVSLVTGAADAAIYAGEGNFIEAGIAAASMIPGGKVVTTAGKVVKGAVGMAKEAGTAAKIAKGAHEAEEVAKAAKLAKEAEEAAKVAKEAQLAKEAKEAEEAAKRNKKDVTIKAREHKVPCFHPFDKKKFMQMGKDEQKAYLKEMAEQLKRQQDAINSLTATEYKAARDAFGAAGRNPVADAAQAKARDKFAEKVQGSIKQSLQNGGMGAAQAKKAAAEQAKEVMGKLAALHEPDMVAGGWAHPDPKGMGRADVNSSIGGSWKQEGRVAGMDAQADNAIKGGKGNEKMNVKLEPCRGKGLK